MNQEFKFKFNEMRENDPAKTDAEERGQTTHSSEMYPSPGNTRNISFVLADGRKQFLNYAYLISVEYNPAEEKIELGFTTHTVVLKGQNLNTLYDDLMHQLLREISYTDERYNETLHENVTVVNGINITVL